MKKFTRLIFQAVSLTLFSLFPTSQGRGQVIPDNSLGAEGSVVTPNVNINGVNSERIDGGAVRGANLFHSFQEFNVGDGLGVYFANPTGIENILTRVTGGNVSNILGTLGVLGNANLFLINPRALCLGLMRDWILVARFMEVLLMLCCWMKMGRYLARRMPTVYLC